MTSKTPVHDFSALETELRSEAEALLDRTENESLDAVRDQLIDVRAAIVQLLSDMHDGDTDAAFEDDRFDSVFNRITATLEAAERKRKEEKGYRRQKGASVGRFRVGYDNSGSCSER